MSPYQMRYACRRPRTSSAAIRRTELARHPALAVLGDFNVAPEDRDVHDLGFIFYHGTFKRWYDAISSRSSMAA